MELLVHNAVSIFNVLRSEAGSFIPAEFCVSWLAMRCPDWTLFLGMSVNVFLGKISIWIGGLSKADGPTPCSQASSNLLRSWIEQKEEKRESTPFLIPAYLLELGHQSSPALALGFAPISTLVLWPLDLDCITPLASPGVPACSWHFVLRNGRTCLIISLFVSHLCIYVSIYLIGSVFLDNPG